MPASHSPLAGSVCEIWTKRQPLCLSPPWPW